MRLVLQLKYGVSCLMSHVHLKTMYVLLYHGVFYKKSIMTTWLIILSCTSKIQRFINFFCKEPDSKYFQFYGPYIPCHTYSNLKFYWVRASTDMTVFMQHELNLDESSECTDPCFTSLLIFSLHVPSVIERWMLWYPTVIVDLSVSFQFCQFSLHVNLEL